MALLSPYVQREVLQQGNGVSHDRPIILPNKASLPLLFVCHPLLHRDGIIPIHEYVLIHHDA